MAGPPATNRFDAQIEQARARGWSAERAAAELGADLGHVLEVWAAMDRANVEQATL